MYLSSLRVAAVSVADAARTDDIARYETATVFVLILLSLLRTGSVYPQYQSSSGTQEQFQPSSGVQFQPSTGIPYQPATGTPYQPATGTPYQPSTGAWNDPPVVKDTVKVSFNICNLVSNVFNRL